MRKIKSTKQIERHMKGISNHWRIAIILLLNESEPLTLDSLVEELKMNTKTASEHTRRLNHAGLINKKYLGREVFHSLSPYGKTFASFLKTFQHS